jgi:hypothetical protein
MDIRGFFQLLPFSIVAHICFTSDYVGVHDVEGRKRKGDRTSSEAFFFSSFSVFLGCSIPSFLDFI